MKKLVSLGEQMSKYIDDKRGLSSRETNTHTLSVQDVNTSIENALLYTIGEMLSCNAMEDILNCVFRFCETEAFADETWCFFITEESETQVLRVDSSKGEENATPPKLVPLTDSLRNSISSKTVSIESKASKKRFSASSSSVVTVPLVEGTEVYAILQWTVNKKNVAAVTGNVDDNSVISRIAELLQQLGSILYGTFHKVQAQADLLMVQKGQSALLNVLQSDARGETLLGIVKHILDGAQLISGAERVQLFSIDWELQELWSMLPIEGESTTSIHFDGQLLGKVATTGESIVVENTTIHSSSFDPSKDNVWADFDIKNVMYVPVGAEFQDGTIMERKPVAVFLLANKTSGGNDFTSNDRVAIETFSVEVAATLRSRSNEGDYIRILRDVKSRNTMKAEQAKSFTSLFESFTLQKSAVQKNVARKLEKDLLGPAPNSFNGGNWPNVSRKGQSFVIPSWHLNVFDTEIDSLLLFVERMYLDFNLVSLFDIPTDTLQNFILNVRDSYRCNPFHNFYHGFSVMHVTYLVLSQESHFDILTPLDILVCLTAALCHDVDHPGHNNAYEINSNSELALEHNDESVLERHHAHTTFRILLQKENSNIMKNLSQEGFKYVRKAIIQTILSTDMSCHFKLCEDLQTRLAKREIYDPSSSILNNSSSFRAGTTQSLDIAGVLKTHASDYGFSTNVASVDTATTLTDNTDAFVDQAEDRLFMMQCIVHASDLSGQVFPKKLALLWGDRVVAEFAAQAVAEKANKLPISFVNADEPLSMAEGQHFFCTKIVAPLWKLMPKIFPTLSECVVNLQSNIIHYEAEIVRLKRKSGDQSTTESGANQKEVVVQLKKEDIVVESNNNEEDNPAEIVQTEEVVPVVDVESSSQIVKQEVQENLEQNQLDSSLDNYVDEYVD